MTSTLLECVPNFSEGRDPAVVRQITAEIEAVDGIRLLHVDMGYDTNRTVVTFVGPPHAVVEAAFQAIRKAADLIDMRRHEGAHPRMGATDVCPLIPISGITMEEAVQWAARLAERVGRELQIPVFLYEFSALRPGRRNLADIRAGEYEALPEKLSRTEWRPDHGPDRFNARSGATVIGARDWLIAYNVNLNSTSERLAREIASDVRERGRLRKEGGAVVRDARGRPVRVPGSCKGVKAIGWYLESFGLAQVSMNLTEIRQTSLHQAFEACRRAAAERGLRVTGSELVGMVPLRVMLEAGRFYLRQQGRSWGVAEAELVRTAVRSLGLDELAPFDPAQKIIEYRLKTEDRFSLENKTVREFADGVASENIAPGGGASLAYAGALGAALGAMVANLSAEKYAAEEGWEAFAEAAERAQRLKDELLQLAAADARAYESVLEARRMPRHSEEQRAARTAAVQEALRRATEIPLQMMRTALRIFDVLEEMVRKGMPAARSESGVGALLARAAVRGAFLNVQANIPYLNDELLVARILSEGQELARQADEREERLLHLVGE